MMNWMRRICVLVGLASVQACTIPSGSRGIDNRSGLHNTSKLEAEQAASALENRRQITLAALSALIETSDSNEKRRFSNAVYAITETPDDGNFIRASLKKRYPLIRFTSESHAPRETALSESDESIVRISVGILTMETDRAKVSGTLYRSKIAGSKEEVELVKTEGQWRVISRKPWLVW